MASACSGARDIFTSRPSNTSYDADHEAASPAPLSNVQRHRNVDARDYMLKRFLPAAQAVAATGAKPSASISSLPSSECRPLPNSTSTVTAKPVSTMSETSRNKKKLSHGVQQDLRGDDAEDENVEMRACGFPLHLGRWTLQHFRYSFWTSRSNSRSPCQATKMDYTKQGNESDNSEDVFWSDEEKFEDAFRLSKLEIRETERESASSVLRKGQLAAEMVPPPIRLHSMETVHTPDHRGFLGLPKASQLTSGEMERARQVDRLGARLTRMLSKTNYMESRNARVHEHDEHETESSGKGPSASTSSSSAEAPRTKWVDAVAFLRPPPSPKMPSESWLSNTLPPERLLQVKRMRRFASGIRAA
ncbi:uncharacterized protein [Physcomitrium patens]|uniref:uncharacterized protein isoform X3 n=1 Tax=Physcomitrium patens TaxID=3218 RepID=UPI000D161D00|nr:uncharacterized protein LOC112279369 isoform X3 [Physcomitrium patens]XP_024369521.1 uncharacterized protein LOC112279369 isoform X3 [Physcomitrium patens]XP_024369522.1 uncharacterized protein LOC112279369 isoform X3 [Physcomitrium patens]|eukprot:XP_024369520.1 uncharacterized protein LOC112279369 isoform X3 [Physcomitrella patens]